MEASMDENNLEFNFTPEQIAEFRQAFDLFDLDGNGTISAGELSNVMGAIGHNPTHEELMEMINEGDVNGDNELEFKEFVAMMAR